MFKLYKYRRKLALADQTWSDGDLLAAADRYQAAIDFWEAGWEAHFGLGVVRKWSCQWEPCLQSSNRAASLNPQFVGAWWNVGIAATALGKWRCAREAWAQAGIDIEISDNPVELSFARAPIRLKPTGEVVWCDRIDPARARIVNVPTKESGHRCGDILLNDGEPVGKRFDGQRDVSVFNELEVLEVSKLGTFVVDIEYVSDEQALALEHIREGSTRIEDWSTMDNLCPKCSAGIPHKHAKNETDSAADLNTTRQFAFAAFSEQQVVAVLDKWDRDEGVLIGPVKCLVEPR